MTSAIASSLTSVSAARVGVRAPEVGAAPEGRDAGVDDVGEPPAAPVGLGCGAGRCRAAWLPRDGEPEAGVGAAGTPERGDAGVSDAPVSAWRGAGLTGADGVCGGVAGVSDRCADEAGTLRCAVGSGSASDGSGVLVGASSTSGVKGVAETVGPFSVGMGAGVARSTSGDRGTAGVQALRVSATAATAIALRRLRP